jgi:hypothetical protein
MIDTPGVSTAGKSLPALFLLLGRTSSGGPKVLLLEEAMWRLGHYLGLIAAKQGLPRLTVALR